MQALLQLLSNLLRWVNDISDPSVSEDEPRNSSHRNQNSEFMKDSNVWDGEEAVEIFQRELGLTADTLEIYKQYLADLIDQQEDMELIFERMEEGKSYEVISIISFTV